MLTLHQIAVPQAAGMLQEGLFPHGRLACISYENMVGLFLATASSS